MGVFEVEFERKSACVNLRSSVDLSFRMLLYPFPIFPFPSHLPSPPIRCMDNLADISDTLQRTHKFDSRIRDKLLTTGQTMLLASVRTLKFGDMFDCLRVIRIIKRAVDSCKFFGEQVRLSLSLSSGRGHVYNMPVQLILLSLSISFTIINSSFRLSLSLPFSPLSLPSLSLHRSNFILNSMNSPTPSLLIQWIRVKVWGSETKREG